MDVLWRAAEPLTVRQVLESLTHDRQLAYTTVMTVMDNLHRKSWLTREQAGRAYTYSPACTREEYTAKLMAEAMTTSHDRKAAFAHFVEHMSPDEVEALREVVRRRRPAREA